MSDIVKWLRNSQSLTVGLDGKLDEAADEIVRLQELLRRIGANRYWEERWRGTEAELEHCVRSNADLSRRLAEAGREIERLRKALKDIILLDGKHLTGRQKIEHAIILAERATTPPPGSAAG